MSVIHRSRRPSDVARRHRLSRLAVGALAVAGGAAGTFAALGSSAAFAGSEGQQVSLVNESSDPVTFNLSGYNQYGQYTTQSVYAYGGQTVNDYNWWWEYGLTVNEVDDNTGELTSFQVDVPVIQYSSDWYTVTGSEPASVALSATPNPGAATQPITLTASVSPSAQAALDAPGQAVAGNVTFFLFDTTTGAVTPLGASSVSNGTASLTTTGLPTGTDYWFASYSGDSLNLATTTNDSSVTVDRAVQSLQLNANPLRFYNHPVDTTATALETVTNVGNVPWTWTSVGTNSPVFGLTAGGTCGATLQPGAACTFKVFFAPKTVGQQTGTIAFSSDFSTPVAFTVAGTGVTVPTVSSISPKSGPATGGTKVTVTGTNLVGITVAHVGSDLTKSVTCPTTTSCTVVTPAGTGTQDITLTDAAGTSAKVTADRFTY